GAGRGGRAGALPGHEPARDAGIYPHRPLPCWGRRVRHRGRHGPASAPAGGAGPPPGTGRRRSTGGGCMKVVTTVCAEVPALPSLRLADYLELTKPRVAVLVLFTAAARALLAAGGVPDWTVLVQVLCGTALVAAGASALNQFLERHSDALMPRTENRPLPSGRLQPAQVFVFGTAAGLGGLAYLALALRQPLA